MTDVLFVCSGNTCRSPMAACLFNDLCRKRGLPYRADSAGLYALEGNAASDGAFFAMKERGLDLSRHAAQPLTLMLARDARLVVAMGEAYAAKVRERCPSARVIALEPAVRDPFGGSLPVYRATADELEARMAWVLAELKKLDPQTEP